MTFSLGTLIQNRYQIISELGSGGMATVYLAHDSQTEKDLALKVLNSDQLDERRKKRFLNEFEILKALSHPGVVTVYEQSEEAGTPFFSMEYIAGQSLSEKIKAEASNSSLSDSLALLKNISQALQYVHEKGVIYCDLKPDNILISGNNEARLLDFGIAQKANEHREEDNNIAGTSLYMSPEQIKNEPLDFRSDIYSFGVLAFELLSGRVPFDSEARFTVTASHLAAKVPSVKDFNPEVPEALQTMIKICMEKDRKNRYEKISQLISKLESIKTEGSPNWLKSLFQIRS